MRYDYNCKKCGIIEISHSMNETIDKCPQCGCREIEKKFVPNFNIIKTGRPLYSYNDVLSYRTVKHEKESRRKVDKKSDGHRGKNRVW